MRKIVILLFTIIISVTLFSGCTSFTINSNPNAPKVEKVTDQKHRYMTENLDFMLKNKNMTDFPPTLPQQYEVTAKVTLKKEDDANRMVYSLLIQHPKVAMHDIMMSFTLNPHMIDHLATGDLFVTNTMNDVKVHLIPNQLPKGLELGRGFVLNPNKIDIRMIDIFPEMYAKISYVNDDHQRVVHYFSMHATYSEELLDYLKKQIAD